MSVQTIHHYENDVAYFFLRCQNGLLYPLFPGSNRLGRDPSINEIILRNPQNSRQICDIHVDSNNITIRSLTQRKMWINERVFSGVNALLQLKSKDILRFSGYQFILIKRQPSDHEDDSTEPEDP